MVATRLTERGAQIVDDGVARRSPSSGELRRVDAMVWVSHPTELALLTDWNCPPVAVGRGEVTRFGLEAGDRRSCRDRASWDVCYGSDVVRFLGAST